ncbi:MAG: Ppx/GppA family phosphatase [Deltaproteobacteria bacterium]|nr:Ppx/GppA family phosphatase [Deltaproteobacteria bacterium]
MKASIDIGSNSILLLVMDGDRVVHDEARVVGLGRGMGETGVFRPERKEAAIAALRDYAAVAANYGIAPANIRAVATSASRRALNAASFYADVKRQTGVEVEVISGEEEARMTYLGGLTGLTLPLGPVLLCDPGGGSTEIILGEGGKILYRVSLEIGTVRLTDAFLGYERVEPPALARCRAAIDEAVATVRLPARPRAVVAVAGTATSLAATNLGLATYDSSLVHNSVLPATALRTWGDRLLAASPAERRSLIVSSPDRADTLLAGVAILLAILRLSGRQSYRISDRGLRYGALET